MISVDQYRACIGCFNNIVRCKQQTCNTTQYMFNRNNFSHSQYKGIFCSVIIVLSCSVSLYKLAMMSFLLLVVSGSIHPNPGPFSEFSIYHINARSLYAFDKDLKSNRTKVDEIE